MPKPQTSIGFAAFLVFLTTGVLVQTLFSLLSSTPVAAHPTTTRSTRQCTPDHKDLPFNRRPITPKVSTDPDWTKPVNYYGSDQTSLKGSISSVTFSPDGKYLVGSNGSENGGIRLWLNYDKSENRGSYKLVGFGQNTSVAFSIDGNLLAASNVRNGSVSLWNWKGMKRVDAGTNKGISIQKLDIADNLQKHFGSQAITFSPNSRMLVSAGVGVTEFYLWDTSRGRLAELGKGGFRDSQDPSPDGQTDAVAFSADSRILATASQNRVEIKLWNVDFRPQQQRQGVKFGCSLPVGGTGISTIAFSPDNKWIASAGVGNTIKLWSLQTMQLQELKGHTQKVNAIAFSPSGKYLLSGGDDRTVKLWQINDGKPEVVASFPRKEDKAFQPGMITAITFRPDGKAFAIGGTDGAVGVLRTSP